MYLPFVFISAKTSPNAGTGFTKSYPSAWKSGYWRADPRVSILPKSRETHRWPALRVSAFARAERRPCRPEFLAVVRRAENAGIWLAIWRQFTCFVFVAVERVDPNLIELFEEAFTQPRMRTAIQPGVVREVTDNAVLRVALGNARSAIPKKRA